MSVTNSAEFTVFDPADDGKPGDMEAVDALMERARTHIDANKDLGLHSKVKITVTVEAVSREAAPVLS